jgi:hypothetical protein
MNLHDCTFFSFSKKKFSLSFFFVFNKSVEALTLFTLLYCLLTFFFQLIKFLTSLFLHFFFFFLDFLFRTSKTFLVVKKILQSSVRKKDPCLPRPLPIQYVSRTITEVNKSETSTSKSEKKPEDPDSCRYYMSVQQ